MLPVFFESRRVGTIESDSSGPRFVYDQDWIGTRGAFPISTTMPLSAAAVPPERFLPWVANLLPEEDQLAAVVFNLKVAKQDVLAILERIGRDTAGALSFQQRGTTASESRAVEGGAALEKIINELPQKPFLVGEDGISMSLAGAQTKIGVILGANGEISIPINGSPSTHIMKPDIKRLWGSVYNEAFCLALAKRCGLDVPSVTTGRAGERTYLVVERYDRLVSRESTRRLHQEDFCQALGRFPGEKYERNQTGNKGPTLVEMFDLMRKVNLRDVPRLFDHLVFNVLCCNTDAHSKNYSMLIRAGGATLAPLYDVMCGAAWPEVSLNLANSIGGKTRGGHLKARHWQREAKACGLAPGASVSRVERLAKTVLENIEAAEHDVESMPGGGHGILGQCVKEIGQRCREVLSGLKESEPVNGAEPEDAASVLRM
jgi:serine/threonine-protein kinase HipA